MGRTLTRKTPSSEFEVTTLVDSTKKEKKMVTSIRNLTLQSYPEVPTYSITF